ncbi:hypothetical protein DPMN_187746 [Dreissena polymorpha]|uniref:Uncharacterized protein n=1 Tax=Dreissena polymorpha TaxID=45954 RepID=A0A9D4I7U1_DREPO|nr:hypothetical protein DPMN_187746 [Dreissena polymorpha]
MSNIEILVINGSNELFEIFRDTSIGILDLRTADCVSLISEILPTLIKLENLLLWGTFMGRCDLRMPSSLNCISLQTGECSSKWLCSLLIKLCALDHHIECDLWNFVLQSHEEDCDSDSKIHECDLRSELLAYDMSNIKILVKNGSNELFEIFRDTSIGILDLRTADCVSLTSDILPTLNKLETLYLWGTFMGRCDLQMPSSLKRISLQTGECSSEWLCSLLIKLSALGHLVKCELYNSVVQSHEDDCDADSYIHGSDLRSKLLACDMSNIEIFVDSGSKELFEIFRDTSIGILYLITADCVSLTSDILPTLIKLEKLYLCGTFMGRCDLQMPSSLNCISLLTGECTSEWLCSLLIKLCALDHHIKCALGNFVVQSRGEDSDADSNKHGSDLRSKLLACDMSNIEILVTSGSKELFAIFRDTSIGILDLRTADCVSLISEILPTLIKLENLLLWGTFMGRCDLRMPSSLNCIRLVSGECTSEWLCSLLIKLCALDHHIECELWNFVVQSRGEDSDADSNKHGSDLRSKLLACDMSNIEISVYSGSKELFEIFRDTSIGMLDLRTADCVSLTSDILPTLNKLEKLDLWGTFMGQCDLQMPSSLNCISLQTGECTSEWLCSLLIKLCASDHHIKCELWNFVVQSRGADSDADSNIHECDPRSKLLACDMSNIEISVKNGSNELFEIFRDTSIGILSLRTADCVSLTSEILPTLIKLEKLYLRGIFVSQCDLQLPASLDCISFQTGECSSELLCSLLIKLSALGHLVKCELWNCVVQSRGEDNGADLDKHGSYIRSKLLSCDLSNFQILVKHGSNELFEIFRDTSIGILDLITADWVSLTSDILPTLIKLEKLYLRGTFMGRCDLKMPSSLKCIRLVSGECTSEWLCSLLINLCALDHHIKCELWNFVVQSRGEDSDADSNKHGSDLRSKLLACDMSNIEIIVKNGSKELFEIFRDTSIGILDLRTADCVSLTSEILPTLSKLKKLLLWGIFVSQCDLQLPASLDCISFQAGECSSEWLCSLLIKLSALGHLVKCELWNCVVQSRGEDNGADLDKHGTDIRSKLLSCDLSNFQILVKHGSNELFEIFRDTSIGVLDLKTADCVSLTSEILPTLNKLETLYIWGTFMGRCDLQMPSSLKRISFQNCECSSKWLSSLLIKLSALGHLVKCELFNFVLQSHEDDCDADSNIHECDLRSKLLACDMSNIEILVKNGSNELFEIFRDTSIGMLDLRTADCVSLTSDILPTLNKLEKLDLWGTFMGRCDLQMPSSLNCISLQTGECTSEWLCSLLIKLCALDHHIKCELWNFVVQSRGEDSDADSNIHECDLRSKLLACDMSNIEISVKNGSNELFEIFRDTSIGILDLRTADCVSLTSDILPTLIK